jgi:diacylglycerol kinase family enzyme
MPSSLEIRMRTGTTDRAAGIWFGRFSEPRVKKIAVLHNPKAGERDVSRKDLLGWLRDAGYAAEYFSLKENEWKERGAFRRAEFVVVAGGDGSVRKAVLRLHDEGRPLAPLPLGTANNICAGLGIRGGPEEIIRGWKAGRRCGLDLGCAEGPWGKRWFVEGVGAGLIARAIAIMASIREASGHKFRRREDTLQHDANVVTALAHELRPVEVTWTLDSRRAKTEEVLLFEILNIPRAGPRLELAPGADPADGVFDVVTVRADEREKLRRHLTQHLAGEKRPVRLQRRRARHVELTLRGAELRLDDEVIVGRPAREAGGSAVAVDIAIESSAVEVLLPA